MIVALSRGVYKLLGLVCCGCAKLRGLRQRGTKDNAETVQRCPKHATVRGDQITLSDQLCTAVPRGPHSKAIYFLFFFTPIFVFLFVINIVTLIAYIYGKSILDGGAGGGGERTELT